MREDEVYKYNESGKIIIIMSHKFAEGEKGESARSYDYLMMRNSMQNILNLV